MKAKDIAKVFEQIAPISQGVPDDIHNGNLGFRIGNPLTEVKGVGVAWALTKEVVEAAVRQKLDMLIIHEPGLFSTWRSPAHSNIDPMTIPGNIRKMKQLMENNIVVYTAHTNWDFNHESGIGPALAKLLGFTDFVKWDVMVGIYRVDMNFGELIKLVKSKMGLRTVRYEGDPKKRIKKIVLSWGSVGSELEAIIANEADAGIFGELREWPFMWARENNVGIIETTHVVSESIGFRPVVTEMQKRLPGMKFKFLEVKYPFKLG